MVITINSRNCFSFYFFNTACYIVCHLTDTSRKVIKLFITFYNFLIKSVLIKFNLIKIINYIIYSAYYRIKSYFKIKFIVTSLMTFKRFTYT